MSRDLTERDLRPSDERSVDAWLDEWSKLVCSALEDAGSMSLASVARRISGITTNEVAMAIGWLSCEGRVQFRDNGGVWTVGLMGPQTEAAVPGVEPTEHAGSR